jgi:DNA (cytosine-5)-methyltransferase 1
MTAPLIIDSFAGGGGASTGIEAALGRSPNVAINHSEAALALHAVNHPDTEHLITSIYRVDPREVVKPGQRVGLAWFSPDCKHFSKAKGGAPLNKNIRDLAWVVVHWAELVRPEVILLENVEEFQTWAPLRQKHEGGHRSTVVSLTANLWDQAPVELKGRPVFNDDGSPFMEPDPLRKGQTFNKWVTRLRSLGYKVEWRELRACDYGAPTIRKRLFVVARCDGQPITWPTPTHGDPNCDEVKSGNLKPWRTAAECIDWSLPCPSIFDTAAQIKEKHGLRAIRPLAANTLARIARGMKRYVLEADRPFLVNLTAPSITRFNGGATGQDMRDPLATVTANSWIKKPGGAAPLGIVTPTLINVANSKTTGRGPNAWKVEEPLRTITSANGFSVVAPNLLSLKGTARRDSGVDAPHPTILAGGGHSAIVAPALVSVAHGDSGGRREYPLTDPYGVVTAGGITHAMFAPMLVQTGYGERDGQAPRALDLNNPLGTVVAGGVKHAPVIAALMGCGGRAAQSRPRGMGEPMATTTAKADTCIAAAFLAQHNSARRGVNPGRPVDAPISTLTGSGSHQNVVAPWFAKYYGTGDGARTDDPLHTITVKDRMGHMQAELAAPKFGPQHETRARQVADFLRDRDAWDGGEFVTLTIDGETFVVVDIGMRMLTPRELFNAQGFPPDYVIEGVWKENGDDWTWQPFTKNVQVSCCGNSVCPPVAEALVRSNCAHLAAGAKETAKEATNG